MKFDFVIGNPPYQEETESESTRNPPVYNLFMDSVFGMAPITELITPARFLFNAGYTPKAWNEKMLNDPHFSVKYYEPLSSKVFPNTSIAGGIVITYRNSNKQLGPIVIFSQFSELNSIISKVRSIADAYLDSIISSPLSYQLTDLVKQTYPDLVDRLRSSAFSNLATIFHDDCPQDSHSYISMIGLENGKRVTKYVRSDFIRDSSDTLNYFKVLMSKANGGAGMIGNPVPARIVGMPLVAPPKTGYTQTFIAIGRFATQEEADNTCKYIRTKFCRTMLGVLKITQDCPGPKWKYVPLQNFTPSSDIDWSQSIEQIDQQLYRKYRLTDEEVSFIESYVKELT